MSVHIEYVKVHYPEAHIVHTKKKTYCQMKPIIIYASKCVSLLTAFIQYHWKEEAMPFRSWAITADPTTTELQYCTELV